MTNEILTIVIKLAAAIALGVLSGNGAVYVFNHVPENWLHDYGWEPPEGEVFYTQRIKSVPWKLAFSLLFCLLFARLFLAKPVYYALAGAVALWHLLLIGLADRKYMVIPDQFTAILALCAIGFVPARASYLDPLWGALLGGGCMLLTGLLGRLIYKRPTLGMGDVKLFCAAGLCLGLKGTAAALIGTSLLAALVYCVRVIRKKAKLGDEQSLGDVAAVCVAAVILLW